MRIFETLARSILFGGILIWVFLKPAGAFTITGSQWAQPGGPGTEITITYGFSNFLDGGFNTVLTPAELRAPIREAFDLWAAVAPLSFVEVVDPAPPSGLDIGYDAAGHPDIMIGYHDFGTSSGSAHALFPFSTTAGLAGDIHFRQDINTPFVWGLNTPAPDDPFELDLLEIMLHEIGHSLGLGHENGVDAIMNSSVKNRFSGLGTGYLLPDDIAGIQAIYGVRGEGDMGGIGAVPETLPAPWVFVAIAGTLLVHRLVTLQRLAS